MVAENPQLCILQFFFSSCFPWSMMLLSRLFFFFQGKGEEGLRLPFLCVRIFFFFFFAFLSGASAFVLRISTALVPHHQSIN